MATKPKKSPSKPAKAGKPKSPAARQSPPGRPTCKPCQKAGRRRKPRRKARAMPVRRAPDASPAARASESPAIPRRRLLITGTPAAATQRPRRSRASRPATGNQTASPLQSEKPARPTSAGKPKGDARLLETSQGAEHALPEEGAAAPRSESESQIVQRLFSALDDCAKSQGSAMSRRTPSSTGARAPNRSSIPTSPSSRSSGGRLTGTCPRPISGTSSPTSWSRSNASRSRPIGSARASRATSRPACDGCGWWIPTRARSTTTNRLPRLARSAAIR